MLRAGNDADNHEFIRSNTIIPVPKILEFWEQPGDRFMMIEEFIECADGNLKSAWPSLSESDRNDVAQQTADYLKQLKSHTKEKVQSIKGGPVCSNGIFNDSHNGPFESNHELFEAMTAYLKKKNLLEKVLTALHNHIPPSQPYTFTHRLLDYSAIILNGKKVVGISGWEVLPIFRAGLNLYLLRRASDKDDLEWKKLLLPKLDQHEDVEDWFHLIRNFENYPELDNYGWDLLKKVEAVADREAEQKDTGSAAGGL